MSHHVAVEIKQEGKKGHVASSVKAKIKCPQAVFTVYYNPDLNLYIPKYIS